MGRSEETIRTHSDPGLPAGGKTRHLVATVCHIKLRPLCGAYVEIQSLTIEAENRMRMRRSPGRCALRVVKLIHDLKIFSLDVSHNYAPFLLCSAKRLEPGFSCEELSVLAN